MAIELDGVNSKVLTDQVDPKSGTNLTLGTSGDSILIPSGVTIANSGTATGFGAIDWQTGSIKTATFAGVAGNGYFCNTTSGEFDITLPSSPSAGDQIGIVDYAGTFDTNTLNVDPNTKKIEGSTDPQGLTAERQSVIIVYVDTTQGWIVTEAGDSTTIAPAVITFTTTAGSIGTILDSQRASGYSLSAVTGTVTFGTLTYSISSGSLPGGLSMNSAGAITGTATAVGSDTVSTFTVLATASGGVTSSREFTIQVDDPIITFTTGAGTLGTIADDERSSYTLSAATATATSGTVSYALQSGAMPTGLSFNTTTAAITGTATAVGTDTTTNFTVRATTTSASEYLDRAFSILVEAPVPFVAATGGTITTDGDYKVHTFTGDGTFVVTNAGGSCGSNSVDYLVIAGGASGGGSKWDNASTSGGGGGAGGYRISFPNPGTGGLPVSATPYAITVGGGGAAKNSSAPAQGTSGSNSVFSSITSAGGGGGGGAPGGSRFGADGGSGGGGAGGQQGSSGGFSGGTGNTPPVSPVQGNNGGSSGSPEPEGQWLAAAGGGGATAAGSGYPFSPATQGGPGGNGTPSTINGSDVTRGGGGGGGGNSDANNGNGGTGGGGGGGDQPAPANPAASGTANTGGGGGGGTGAPAAPGTSSGAGGSGIVIIRYKFQ